MSKIYMVETLSISTEQAHRVLALTLIKDALEDYQAGNEDALIWLKETGIHWFQMAGYNPDILREKIVDIT